MLAGWALSLTLCSMLTIDFLLVLGAALGFATLDLLRKLLAERLAIAPLLFWLTVGATPLYVGWFVLSGSVTPETAYWIPAISSVLLNVAANLLYLHAVHVGEFSRTIPLLSLTPVLTALSAIPLLNEVPTPLQWIGILLVVVGAAWLQSGVQSNPQQAGAWWRRIPLSARLMLVVACLWSVTTPLDKLALRSAGVAFHALFLHIGIAVALVGWLVHRGEIRRVRELRDVRWLLLAAILVSAVALGSQLMALERVLAALLETMKRGLGGVVALTLGFLFFRERIAVSKVLAVAIMIAGVGMLMF